MKDFDDSYFTKSKDGNILYVHRLNSTDKITIPDLKLKANRKITILGADTILDWQQKGDDIEVMIPRNMQDSAMWPNQYGYTLKVEL